MDLVAPLPAVHTTPSPSPGASSSHRLDDCRRPAKLKRVGWRKSSPRHLLQIHAFLPSQRKTLAESRIGYSSRPSSSSVHGPRLSQKPGVSSSINGGNVFRKGRVLSFGVGYDLSQKGRTSSSSYGHDLSQKDMVLSSSYGHNLSQKSRVSSSRHGYNISGKGSILSSSYGHNLSQKGRVSSSSYGHDFSQKLRVSSSSSSYSRDLSQKGRFSSFLNGDVFQKGGRVSSSSYGHDISQEGRVSSSVNGGDVLWRMDSGNGSDGGQNSGGGGGGGGRGGGRGGGGAGSEGDALLYFLASRTTWNHFAIADENSVTDWNSDPNANPSDCSPLQEKQTRKTVYRYHTLSSDITTSSLESSSLNSSVNTEIDSTGNEKPSESDDNLGSSDVDLEQVESTEALITHPREISHGLPCVNEEDGKKQRNAQPNEVLPFILEQLQIDGKTPLAERYEVETLGRLQCAIFSDVLKMKEQIEKLEQKLIASQRAANAGKSSKEMTTVLKGEVRAGSALVVIEDSNSRQARSSLEQAGMQTGLDVKFTFETPFREKDVLVTKCEAGQGSSVGDGRVLGGPLNLTKVLYSACINDALSLSVVPFGAQGKDVTEVVNPLQDQSLTEFSSNGPALFNHCKGSALGVRVSGSNLALSVAQYLSGWSNQISTLMPSDIGNDPLCLSTLGQVLFHPSKAFVIGISALNRYWPTPPLPSTVGLHWSEMGPLVLPRIQTHETRLSRMGSSDGMGGGSYESSLGATWGFQNDCNDAPENKGTASQFVAVAARMELFGQVSAGAWAQMERADWLNDSGDTNVQWTVNLAKDSGSGFDWGVSLGCSRRDLWSTTTGSGIGGDQDGYFFSSSYSSCSYGPQLQLEAFLKFHPSKGFTMQPGLLYVSNKQSQTPVLMLKSSWAI